MYKYQNLLGPFAFSDVLRDPPVQSIQQKYRSMPVDDPVRVSAPTEAPPKRGFQQKYFQLLCYLTISSE